MITCTCEHRAPEFLNLSDLEKRGKWKLAPIGRNRASVRKFEIAFRKAVRKWFAANAKHVTEQLQQAMADMRKADEGRMNRILQELTFTDLIALFDETNELYARLTDEGGMMALSQIGIGDTDEQIVNQVHRLAVEWSESRAAELVGMRMVGGELIENPNAQWRITDQVRESLRATVRQSLEEGWSPQRLAAMVRDSYGFSDERAMMIARTEAAFADVAGNMIGYRESGVVTGKRWILAAEGVCPTCEGAAARGEIPLDEAFINGIQQPPAHPNCRCDIVPIVGD